MLRQNPHLLLMGALGFSALDLSANSQGELSHQQKKQLENARFRQLEAWTLAAVLVWVIGLPIHALLLVMLFLTAAIISVMIATWHRIEEDLSGRIEVVNGRLEMSETVLPFPGRYLQMNGERFSVSHEVAEAFIPGRIYRLYFTPGSRTILSAELLA